MFFMYSGLYNTCFRFWAGGICGTEVSLDCSSLNVTLQFHGWIKLKASMGLKNGGRFAVTNTLVRVKGPALKAGLRNWVNLSVAVWNWLCRRDSAAHIYKIPWSLQISLLLWSLLPTEAAMLDAESASLATWRLGKICQDGSCFLTKLGATSESAFAACTSKEKKSYWHTLPKPKSLQLGHASKWPCKQESPLH